ncbi:hypothetical protein HMPREF9134_00269 [Porphyromonas catoniae F0037]|uniref:Uncharacterized protein n=1 Tax=Porphyromonas catoniae F0037 TaxID=1127696 RepID=L1NHN6_9PORP|nr:hypothetical protein HMPREF9134_00269 [Porphyromonas catoniae F0037]
MEYQTPSVANQKQLAHGRRLSASIVQSHKASSISAQITDENVLRGKAYLPNSTPNSLNPQGTTKGM